MGCESTRLSVPRPYSTADAVETQGNAYQRTKETQESGKGKEEGLGGQEREERVLRRVALNRLLDRLPRNVDRQDSRQHDQSEKDHEAETAEMIRELFPIDDGHRYASLKYFR